MTFTYTLEHLKEPTEATEHGQPEHDLARMRLALGDTREKGAIKADEELRFFLDTEESFEAAVASAAEAISADYAHEAEVSVGQLSVKLAVRSQGFARIAERFRADAGGASRKKRGRISTIRRAPSMFGVGMHDNPQERRGQFGVAPDPADEDLEDLVFNEESLQRDAEGSS